MEFKPISKANYSSVAKIYQDGISTGVATFETKVPIWDVWSKAHLPFGCIALFTNEGTMQGWASLAAVSSRCVYGGVAEVSVYVAANARGKGYGKLLLKQLITISEQNNIWTLQAGIMRANKASLHLHKECGFREIGYREKIGRLNGKWLDNIILERRSAIVGI